MRSMVRFIALVVLALAILVSGALDGIISGWRNPDSEEMDREVRDGILSLESARRHYGVALDPDTCEVLAEETARLRANRSY
ncbi:MAG: hypothetical protein AB1714_22160 [Acidobacteriota bacterium]